MAQCTTVGDVDMRVRNVPEGLQRKLGAWAQLLGIKRDELVVQLLETDVETHGPKLKSPTPPTPSDRE